jgi:inosine/guanosine/xanthosine phosphorylase family protein
MSDNPSELIERAAAVLRARLGESFPKTAIVLGSGLGRFADKLAHARSMSYADIPGFSRSTVAGHHGNLLVGEVGGAPLAVMQGRIHAYEGHPPQAIAVPIRTLRRLGVERLVLTNASGGLKADMPAGTLMIVKDHINFSGINPLAGPNDDSVGPRFPDMSSAYDPELRAMLADAAREAGVAVRTGVYLFTLGPNFETPAEVRMFASLGADAVGMSTVPECLAARHCGMKVAALSLVTNLAAGLSTTPLSHEETLAAAQSAYEKVERVLLAFLAKCASS